VCGGGFGTGFAAEHGSERRVMITPTGKGSMKV
jgi:hypothetical protein